MPHFDTPSLDTVATKDTGKIGPEFTFGIYTEKALNEPILIIKTAWGGRSLNTEFRPPSAGQYKLPKEIQELWDKHPQGAHGIPKAEDRKKWQADKDAASGVFYRMMIDHVKKGYSGNLVGRNPRKQLLEGKTGGVVLRRCTEPVGLRGRLKTSPFEPLPCILRRCGVLLAGLKTALERPEPLPGGWVESPC